VIEIMEAAGRLDRAVDGLGSNEELLRRAQDGRGLTRPELAVLLSHGKLALQDAIEQTDIADCPSLEPLLLAQFPEAMRTRFRAALTTHRLRGALIATAMANRIVNRLGVVMPFELAEEAGASLDRIGTVYFAADAIFGLDPLWQAIETADLAESERLALLDRAAAATRRHLADLLRATRSDTLPGAIAERLSPGIARLAAAQGGCEDAPLADRIARLEALDGAVGIAGLALTLGVDEIAATTAYTRLGAALGLDWASAAALAFASPDPWERLLVAGLIRDFEQLRLDFLERRGDGDPVAAIDAWLLAQEPRVAQFRQAVERARTVTTPNAAMLAHLASQARILLSQ